MHHSEYKQKNILSTSWSVILIETATALITYFSNFLFPDSLNCQSNFVHCRAATSKAKFKAESILVTFCHLFLSFFKSSITKVKLESHWEVLFFERTHFRIYESIKISNFETKNENRSIALHCDQLEASIVFLVLLISDWGALNLTNVGKTK